MADGDSGRSPASLDLAIAWLGRRIAEIAATPAAGAPSGTGGAATRTGRVRRPGPARHPEASRPAVLVGPPSRRGLPPARRRGRTWRPPRPPSSSSRRPARRSRASPRRTTRRPSRGSPARSRDRRRVGRARAFGGFRSRPTPTNAAQPARHPAAAPDGSRATPLLDEIGRDLTALAREGMLPPAVGRDAETDRVVEALVRPTRPSAVLLGPEGSARRASSEGLAERVVAGGGPGAAPRRADHRGPDLRARRRHAVPGPAGGAAGPARPRGRPSPRSCCSSRGSTS